MKPQKSGVKNIKNLKIGGKLFKFIDLYLLMI